MKWKVLFSNKAGKQAGHLNEEVLLALQLLIDNLRTYGPSPGKNWFNYGKLHGKKGEDKRHCHLMKGRPTYVCCWKVYKLQKYIEVYYVGTHEKAPY